jgi:hypothetical protein
MTSKLTIQISNYLKCHVSSSNLGTQSHMDSTNYSTYVALANLNNSNLFFPVCVFCAFTYCWEHTILPNIHGNPKQIWILYGGKIWGFLVYFTILFFFQHKVFNFRNFRNFMDIIHLPPFSHNKHQKII